MFKPLRAGTARVDITPSRDVPLAGNSFLRYATGVEGRLYARILVLEQGGFRVAFIAADIIGTEVKMVQRMKRHLKKKCGINLLVFNSSHTHAGPDTYDEFCIDATRASLAARRRYQHKLETTLNRLIGRVVKKLEPVVLDYGTGRSSIGINRRKRVKGAYQMLPNPGGYHDKTVSVYRFTTPRGKTKAVLFSYACHPTSRYSDRVAPDFPGPATAYLERKTGACALFIQGACGEIRPRLSTPGYKAFRPSTLRDVRNAGESLAREVLRVMGKKMRPIKGTLHGSEANFLLPYDRLPTRKTFEAVLRDQSEDRVRCAWARFMQKQLKGKGFAKGVPMELILLRFSPQHAMVAGSNEFCNGYVPLLKKLAPGIELTVIGYITAMLAYIPTEKIRREGGYEGDWSYYGQKQPAKFSRAVQPLILKNFRRLLAQESKRP